MSSYVLPRGRFASIRVRELTKFLIEHIVDATEEHTNATSQDDFLWKLEAKARDESIYGHGVHFIVTPEGQVVRDRPIELHGSVNRQWNRSSIFIRVPVINGSYTEAQEDALYDLMDDIESKYPRMGYHKIQGWEALQA